MAHLFRMTRRFILAAAVLLSMSGAPAFAASQDNAAAMVSTPSPILSPGFDSLPMDAEATFGPRTPTVDLANMLATDSNAAAMTQDMHCLASAIYFEARSEALDGQLAVGRVIVARTKSGIFPKSYCGVVQQPSQFSFVRHKRMPNVDTGSITWKKAVAVAQIAHEGKLKSAAEGALYFQSSRSKARLANRLRVAQIDNHIFYR